MWQLIYSRDQGLINDITGGTTDWYGDQDVNLWAVLVATCWKQTGYVMLLYLAGLKAVDPSLREAATVDGATETQTFFRVVFPVMRPSTSSSWSSRSSRRLRAFEIVWVVNKGRNGLELISTLVTNNIVGEASRIGFGSALATIMLAISSVFVVIYLRIALRRRTTDEPPSSPRRSTACRTDRPSQPSTGRRKGPRRFLHAFLIVMSLIWLFPLLYAVMNSLRSYEYTQENGYLSFGGWTFDNYTRRGAGRLLRQVRQHPLHHRPRRPADAVPVLLHGVRAGQVQLPAQPDPARHLPRRQPVASAGPADPAVPHVPRDPGARGG